MTARPRRWCSNSATISPNSRTMSTKGSARRRRGRQSPPERRDSRRWHRASPLRPRDLVVDILCEDVERDVAAFDDDIVEIAPVVAVAERRLGAAALADDLAVADPVPARRPATAAITVDLQGGAAGRDRRGPDG